MPAMTKAPRTRRVRDRITPRILQDNADRARQDSKPQTVLMEDEPAVEALHLRRSRAAPSKMGFSDYPV